MELVVVAAVPVVAGGGAIFDQYFSESNKNRQNEDEQKPVTFRPARQEYAEEPSRTSGPALAGSLTQDFPGRELLVSLFKAVGMQEINPRGTNKASKTEEVMPERSDPELLADSSSVHKLRKPVEGEWSEAEAADVFSNRIPKTGSRHRGQ